MTVPVFDREPMSAGRLRRILGSAMRPELDDTLAAGSARTVTKPGGAAASAAGSELAAGQQLGHFRIDKPLGAGGMGEVYLATDLALDRPVAIKVLPAGVARDPARRDRLVREARAQARITHPNVGHIYFIGEEAGRLYFAMEYVAGQTLATRLAAGPVAVDDALSVVRSAALGLREAQKHGITHRDIKPSNLMIDGHGLVKVLDFGLAAGSLGGEGAIPSGPVAQTSFAGTPLYMAPEQARGEPVDFRADVYALGATLFHLVAGKPPFEADDLGVLLSKHASAERPALPRRSGTPRTTIAAIDALCSRMMATSPADRFASYDDLIRAIELASVEHMRPAGLAVRSMTTLVDLLIASAATFAVLGLLALLVRRGGGDWGGFVFVFYALIGTVSIARTGRTPGQWLFELEVINVATGGKPSLGRAAVRVVLPIALPCIGLLIKFGLEQAGYKLSHPVGELLSATVVIAPISLVWASLRSVGKQTFWDKLSGTMVRYRTRRATPI
jgi:predicted Ser/Thr protein kinase